MLNIPVNRERIHSDHAWVKGRQSEGKACNVEDDKKAYRDPWHDWLG